MSYTPHVPCEVGVRAFSASFDSNPECTGDCGAFQMFKVLVGGGASLRIEAEGFLLRARNLLRVKGDAVDICLWAKVMKPQKRNLNLMR